MRKTFDSWLVTIKVNGIKKVIETDDLIEKKLIKISDAYG